MPTPTDDRRDLLTVIASMRARPGKEQDLRDALEALIAPTTQEAGYVTYDLHQGGFDVDERCIGIGVRLLVATALEALLS